jgi:NAD(P)-dependent dehydrogenase (short-subunit alcohol dehydrogenase family)
MQKQKNVLITGVSTGIGAECAKVFAGNGYRVFGSVRKEADAQSLKDELGDQFEALVFDVTDHEAVDRAAEQLTKVLDGEGLACLINNAGMAVSGPMMHVSMEDLKLQFDVNVIGLVKVTQAFLPLLGAKKDYPHHPGKILNISSVAGKIGMPFMGPYVGSKHALEGISESMRRELMLYGIDVIVIGPGAIKTPIWNKGMDQISTDNDFAESLQIFGGRVIKGTLKHALEPDDLARSIFNIFNSTSPKVRYAFVSEKFKGWVLPRLLPSRFIDRAIAKMLKLKRR